MAEVFNTGEDLRSRGFSMRDAPINILSYDPAGDGSDHDALVLVSKEEHRRGEMHDPDLAVIHVYRVVLAHRMAAGMEFPDKLATIIRLNKHLLLQQRKKRQTAHVVVVEANGVGWAMASALRSKTSVPVMPYVTVGTAIEKPFTDKQYSMPRLAALDNLRVLIETHRVKVLKDAAGRDTLAQELGAFVWASPGRPEAIKGQHDDLVMALAGACWAGEKIIAPQAKQAKIDPRQGIKDHAARIAGRVRLI